MTNLETYNNNKATVRELQHQNKELRVVIFEEIGQLIEGLKLSELSSKAKKAQAIKTISEKYTNCKYEIALVKFFIETIDLHYTKLPLIVGNAHKIRLQFNKGEITKKDIFNFVNKQ